jgi:hypothetical protein
MPKKLANGGGSEKGAPQKGLSAKFCMWCQAADGPFTTHDTIECRRFSKNGSPKDKPTKPFDTTKKPWKKTGREDYSQMTYLREVAKLEKKLKKSKKNGKKHACNSSDSDSDSD